MPHQIPQILNSLDANKLGKSPYQRSLARLSGCLENDMPSRSHRQRSNGMVLPVAWWVLLQIIYCILRERRRALYLV